MNGLKTAVKKREEKKHVCPKGGDDIRADAEEGVCECVCMKCVCVSVGERAGVHAMLLLWV